MKFSKSVRRTGLLVLVAVAVGIGGAVVPNYFAPKTITIDSLYIAEAKQPKWITKNAELIVIGKVINKANPVKIVVHPKDNDEEIYTDTHIEITKIYKDKTGKNFKEGDTVSVRTVGGTVGNLTLESDQMNLMPTSGNVMLYLGDSSSRYPDTKNQKEPVFMLAGGIHGAFEFPATTKSLTSNKDTVVKRSIVKDEFKLSDLEKVINEEK